ncbi:MAG: hypothetical protein QE278_07525 [Limnobacter sp.]|nr:hypothetical protein [Limnobacter sp.]
MKHSASGLGARFCAAAFGLVLLPAILAGCGSEEQASTSAFSANGTNGANGTSNNTQRAETMALPGSLGCAWAVSSDDDKVNVAFPDSQAKYWVSMAPITPGTRLRIDGKFPDARYFSFNSYDLALRPVDAIADQEMTTPDGNNPFVKQDAKPGGSYTAYLQYGESPSQNSKITRQANTFYSGNVELGPVKALPNAGMVLFIYRIYVSNKGEFFDGGVGLPRLTLETADGSREIAQLPNCTEATLPNLGGNLPPLGLNETLLGLDYPDPLKLDFPTATYPPSTVKFFGLSETVTRIVAGRTGLEPPVDLSIGAGGFLSNIHNAYTTTGFSRRYGNIAMVRAKAPSYRGEKTTAFGQENLRYWSVCGNEFATQRFTECAADFQTPLDDEGYFTVVMSDPADRPKNATAENGFTWLPWGPYPDQLLLYRHMLHNPNFAEAIQNVAKKDDLFKKMGDFAPVGTYCRKDVFLQSNRPSDTFKICTQDQNKNPPRLTN